jgi:hypothetical protein
MIFRQTTIVIVAFFDGCIEYSESAIAITDTVYQKYHHNRFRNRLWDAARSGKI